NFIDMAEDENVDNLDGFLDGSAFDDQSFIVECGEILKASGDNPVSRLDAIARICNMLIPLENETLESLYIKSISSKYNVPARYFQNTLKSIRSRNGHSRITEKQTAELDDLDSEVFRRFGFWEEGNRYYFKMDTGTFKASNFIIKPLFHIYSKSENNKRLIHIINELGQDKILDMPSKSLVSLDQFQQLVFSEGNYLFFGSRQHFIKILAKISNEFQKCNELRVLGWQKEGFYAFANGIVSDTWHPVDKFGMTDHDGQKYFSPAFSEIYKDVREDDDEYENDRSFIFQSAPLPFDEWCQLMCKVYGDNGVVAVAFALASVFRDLIYDTYKMFPHLFLFGEKQSGKSQLGWSLSSLFYSNLQGFNLNSGTQVGFFRKLSRVRNSVAWFDEYTNEIDERRFQSLKAAYDGMGHEKGKMSKDLRTEITRVNSSCVISGQYLPTRDDNALFTRSILLSFYRQKYSTQQVELFDKLKALERETLSGMLLEILPLRPVVADRLPGVYSIIFDALKIDLGERMIEFDERLIRNFTTILAPVKILESHLSLGFSFEQLYKISLDQIEATSHQLSSSEALAAFLRMIEYFYENHSIEDGVDFKINSRLSLKVVRNNNEAEEVVFPFPVKIIYLRFNKIHPQYLHSFRNQYSRNGLDLTSLLHYLKHHKAYIGSMPSTRFKGAISNCWCFKYELLGINLEKFSSASFDNTVEVFDDDPNTPDETKPPY
ncbi:MAG TPA: hypothetical protein P5184_00225, partial [Bacteroidales bacterium]|nr:hypothetical protein [Bacteroidales bacterium]